MSILELGSLQLTLFAMMLIGALLKKKDIIDENGKKCLSDLCINNSHPVQHLQILPHRVGRGCDQVLCDAVCERNHHAAFVSRFEPVPF